MKEIKTYSLDLMTDELYEIVGNPLEEKLFAELLEHPDVSTGLYGMNPDGAVQHFLYDTPEHRAAAHKILSKHLKTVAFNLHPVYIPAKYAKPGSYESPRFN